MKIIIIKYKYLIIITTFASFFFIYTQIEQPKFVTNEMKNTDSFEDWIIRRDSIQQLILNNLNIKKSIYLFSETQDSLNIKFVIEKHFCVFLLIPENACGYCLDAEIGNMNLLYDNFPNNTFKIITKFRYKNEIRNFRVFNRIKKLDILSIGENNIGIKPYKIHTPFYVIIRSDLVIQDVFIPNPKMKDLTVSFLNQVLNVYF